MQTPVCCLPFNYHYKIPAVIVWIFVVYLNIFQTDASTKHICSMFYTEWSARLMQPTNELSPGIPNFRKRDIHQTITVDKCCKLIHQIWRKYYFLQTTTIPKVLALISVIPDGDLLSPYCDNLQALAPMLVTL